MTWADQQMLNRFATENNRRHALNAEIAGLKVRRIVPSLPYCVHRRDLRSLERVWGSFGVGRFCESLFSVVQRPNPMIHP